MNRKGAKAKNNPKPVTKVEVSEKHVWLRVVLFIVFLVIAVVAIAAAVRGLFGNDDGWRIVEVNSNADVNCGEDFSFAYYIGGSGIAVGTQYRSIASLYTEAAVKAYRLFDTFGTYDGVVNLRYISLHPNEEVEVDELLYNAFALSESYGSRYVYLAPVYAYYAELFGLNALNQTQDYVSYDYDPFRNEQLAELFLQIAAFANDSQSVEVQLLGNNKIKLYVSEEYLQFASDHAVESFVDFFWLKNAFIIDYFAQTMVANGYTDGYIASRDGFFRNLDQTTVSSYTVTDLYKGDVYAACAIKYEGKISVAAFRNYAIYQSDARSYFRLENGELRTSYVDVADGLCKSSTNSVVAYSSQCGCAEAALGIAPIYIADEFDSAALAQLKAGVDVVYFDGLSIVCTNPNTEFVDIYNENGVEFTLTQSEK